MLFTLGATASLAVFAALLILCRKTLDTADKWMAGLFINLFLISAGLAWNIENWPTSLVFRIYAGGTGFIVLPIMLFQYILATTAQFHRYYLLLFLIPVFHLFMHTFNHLWGGQTDFVSGFVASYGMATWAQWLGNSLLLMGIILPLWSLLILKKYRIKLSNNMVDIEDYTLSWAAYVPLTGIVGTCICIVALVILDGSPNIAFQIVIWVLALQTVALAYFAINQRRLPLTSVESTVKPATADNYEYVINKLEETVQKHHCYLEEEFTLKKLSEQSGLPEYDITDALSAGKSNFRSFINQFRVKQAKFLLSQSNNKDEPILNLGLKAGFQSKATFNRVFKQHVGLTPSEYREKSSNPE